MLFWTYFFNEQTGWTVIPVFNYEVISTYRWLIVGAFLLCIGKEILKLIYGRWTLRLSLLVSALALAALVLSIVVLSNPGIWNPDFAADLTAHTNFDFGRIWTQVTRNLVIVIIAAYLIETATALYKGIRYSNL